MDDNYYKQAYRYGEQIGSLLQSNMIREAYEIHKAWVQYLGQFKNELRESVLIAFHVGLEFDFSSTNITIVSKKVGV